jgi:FlaA1/EpsC-like NDP-sugar epimerase
MFLFYLPEDSVADGSSFSSETKLYLRRENIIDLPKDVSINIEELEKIYLSAIIQEIYMMYIDDPRSNRNNRSKQLLAAVVVSQTNERVVLEGLESISRLKQLSCFQMPQVVLIERESLKIVEGSKLSSLEQMNRETLENRYRTKVLNILLKYENVEGETVDISSNNVQEQEMASSHLLIEKDMILDPILQLSIETINRIGGKDIFLTGSTGFLGAYLLDELLKQADANIYCLVRSKSSTNTLRSRVFYLHGDLALPQLGLDEHEYAMLVSKIRSIYHCGAAVNFIKSYNELRAANVLGTVELIKLSYLANCRINFISTLSVLDRNDQSGYVQSKQVAEHLLEQASEKGLLVTIFRPGKIVNFYQHLVNFIANRFHIMVFVNR